MIADIILIAVMLICVFFGYKRGLIKVAAKLLSFVISIVIALILYTPISNYIIENTEIVPNLKNTIYTTLYGNEEEPEYNEDSGNLVDNIENFVSKYAEEAEENTSDFVSEELALIIVRVGTWILLFIGVKVITIFIRIFTDAIASIPIIKQFNKLRWINIWNTRGICDYLCSSCNN